MSANGGASMQISSQTSASQQQAYAAQIAYNMQNNIPFSMTTAQGDAGAQTIAQSIYNQAQVIAMTPQSAPTVGTQVAASTTGSNPAAASNTSNDSGFLNFTGGYNYGDNAQGQTAEDTQYNPITGQSGAAAGNPSTVTAPGETGSSALDWIQSHFANYGLVILGGILVIGALLISQRKSIETVVTTAGKVAAVAA